MSSPGLTRWDPLTLIPSTLTLSSSSTLLAAISAALPRIQPRPIPLGGGGYSPNAGDIAVILADGFAGNIATLIAVLLFYMQHDIHRLLPLRLQATGTLVDFQPDYDER